ncbi:uncharacterized protein LOC134797365 [Cydia splendana]|uniref:uncharacterized protein LOC134797365 n=1 Tax=Cydia splendana TaxID=1100963 RepID=UPI00300C963C
MKCKGGAIDVFVSKAAGDSVGQRAAAAAAQLNRYYIDANVNNSNPCARTALAYLDQYLQNAPPAPYVLEPFTLNEILITCKKIKRKKSKDNNDMSTEIIDCFPPVVISLFLLRQATYVLNTKSILEPIGCSAVPQGSVMGNNLFLILVNDITTACPYPEYVMFADDTCIIVNADNFDNLKLKLAHVMHQMAEWFTANGMLLNVDKTNIIHFQLKKTHNPINIKVNDITVPQVDTTRYLGYMIDAGLTWAAHVDHMFDKLSSACYALSRLAPTLSANNLRKAYFGYFHSVLIQGIDLWATSATWERLFKLQKRALRIIDRKPLDHPAKEIFKNHKILTLPSIYILTACDYIRENLHNYQTLNRTSRRQPLLIAPNRRLAKARAALSVAGASIYNHVPLNIKEAKSNAAFSKKLKA